MIKFAQIPVSVLREWLICDTDAGVLTWKKGALHSFVDSRVCNSWSGRFAGSYKSFEEAVSVANKARADFGFHPNHGRIQADKGGM